MERPGRWTLVTIILYLSFQVEVLCKNKNDTTRENRECTKLPPNTSAGDIYNSILTTAACNGVLPDLIPMLQGQSIDNQKFPYPQDILTKPLSVVPMTCPQEPIIFSSQPLRTPATNQNILVATPLPCGSSCPSNIIPAIPQTISLPPVPPSNCISQITQALPLENYPVCAPNVVRPMPIVLQPQSQCNEANPYFYNQIAEPISLPDVCTNPLNVPTLPPIPVLPPINSCSGALELTSNLLSPCLSQPIALANDCQQAPLQINVPASTVVPKVTVVSASPPSSPVPLPCCPDYSANLPYQYPPQPPIVVGGSSKSSWKKWLPIILWALFNDRGSDDRGCGNGGGCCRCCCSCSSDAGNNVPIPYPIPIPINNPIINRNSRNLDDGDDEDDWKRK